MKSLPGDYLSFETETLKPFISIQIASTLNKEDHKLYTALIDTGATNTVLSKKVGEQLVLKKLEEVTASTPTDESIILDLYEVSVKIEGTHDSSGMEERMKVAMARVNFTQYDVILGLDILQKGTFVYDGIHKTYSLSFLQKKSPENSEDL